MIAAFDAEPTVASKPEFVPNSASIFAASLEMAGALRMPPLSELTCGALVPRTPYRVVAKRCAGGMGELFDVEHERLGRRAVLKVLHPRLRAREGMALRLLGEARALAAIGGTHVPLVYDVGELDDGRPFLVMEQLDGSDLRSDLRRLGSLSVPSAVRIVAALLDALVDVHKAGFVHRDIKADNVFVCSSGRVVLLDFGIARRLDATLRLTGKGLAVGTPRSMAPEQHLGEDVDARADLYATGLLLYELVTGEGPFDDLDGTPETFRAAHCRRLPTPPSMRARQAISPGVEHVILRALEKREDRRFASARQMAEALATATRHPSDPDDAPTLHPAHGPREAITKTA